VPAAATPALLALSRSSVAHVVHEYALPERHGREREDRRSYGTEAAEALGVDPARVLKTLIARLDDSSELVVGVVPVDAELDPKALAAALGGRRATLAPPDVAERASGSVVGGISPLGMRRRLRTVVDDQALRHETVLVSAGRRGLQVELAPADLVRLTGAATARIRRTP
jgi:Cys-tRNA(Pro)/Cys-tRNA(Cys) deacylase